MICYIWNERRYVQNLLYHNFILNTSRKKIEFPLLYAECKRSCKNAKTWSPIWNLKQSRWHLHWTCQIFLRGKIPKQESVVVRIIPYIFSLHIKYLNHVLRLFFDSVLAIVILFSVTISFVLNTKGDMLFFFGEI